MVPYLEGHSLYGYITGETPAPPKEIVSSASTSTTPTTTTMVVNLAYALCKSLSEILFISLSCSSIRPVNRKVDQQTLRLERNIQYCRETKGLLIMT